MHQSLFIHHSHLTAKSKTYSRREEICSGYDMAFGVFNKAFEFNESALRTTKGKGGQFQIFHIDVQNILFYS